MVDDITAFTSESLEMDAQTLTRSAIEKVLETGLGLGCTYLDASIQFPLVGRQLLFLLLRGKADA